MKGPHTLLSQWQNSLLKYNSGKTAVEKRHRAGLVYSLEGIAKCKRKRYFYS
jgi:hypothetical protein